MECFASFLILICVFAVLIAGVGKRLSSRRGRRRNYQELARRFAGHYHRGGLYSKPLVLLRYGATSAVVTETRDVGPLAGTAFQVSVTWPHSQARCALVAASGYPLRPDRVHAWPRVSLADAAFAEHYAVISPEPTETRQLLTSGVCWHIDRLRRLGGDGRLYVLIEDGQIQVQKYWRRPSGELSAQFVQGVLELYDQCMLARASGIEFLAHDQASTLEDVTCKICGEAIDDDLVYCRRCKTPHHQECWRYAGICSVFGCRETVYLLPQHGQAIQPPAEDDHRIKKPR